MAKKITMKNLQEKTFKDVYEQEILEMRKEGKTKREICEKFGFTMYC